MEARNLRKERTCVVVSNKMDKTITVARQPPDLAGIPQQQDITFYPVGRKGALSGIGTARSIGSKL